jgi:hypothetical protein
MWLLKLNGRERSEKFRNPELYHHGIKGWGDDLHPQIFYDEVHYSPFLKSITPAFKSYIYEQPIYQQQTGN